MDPAPRRPLLLIFLIVVVNLIGFGIIIPLLPFYAESLGASPLTIGLIFASYSLCQLLAAPLLGELSDRWGRRPVLLLSLVGTVISFAMLALAQSVPLLFAARVVDGLSGGNISTARAYIADVTPPERRARAYGLIGAGFGIGFILGPALGGLLGRFGYAAPAWAAAGLALIAAILTWLWLPETKHAVSARRPAPWREIPRMMFRPRLGPLLAVDFLYWAAFAVYQTTFALFAARRFNFDVTATGQLLAALGVIGVFVQLRLIGPTVARLGERGTLALGLALGAVGLGTVAFADSVLVFYAALVPAAVGIGLAGPSLSSLLSQAVQGDEQGRLQGVASSLESLGRTVGPIWGSGALAQLGDSAAYGSAAFVLLLVAGWATRLRPREASTSAGT
jgi:DHA1 family tetracycline resistance protein-like MFS transporter